MRRGFQVDIGINANKEIDFVARKDEKLLYIQVAYSVIDPEKRETELASFKNLDDGFRKILITMDDDPFDNLRDGYQKIYALDFLLDPQSV